LWIVYLPLWRGGATPQSQGRISSAAPWRTAATALISDAWRGHEIDRVTLFASLN